MAAKQPKRNDRQDVDRYGRSPRYVAANHHGFTDSADSILKAVLAIRRGGRAMFSFFRKKHKVPKRLLPRADSLSDSDLIELILGVFQGQSPVIAALFLVAYENAPIWLALLQKYSKENSNYSSDYDGLSSFFADGYAEHDSGSDSDEVARRRFFYFYIAALLRAVQIRARTRPVLWEEIVDVWLAILPGSRELRATLDRVSLWRAEDVAYFDDILTEDDGERHVISIVMPSAIRFHEKVVAWEERNLPEDVKKLVNETFDHFAGTTTSPAGTSGVDNLGTQIEPDASEIAALSEQAVMDARNRWTQFDRTVHLKQGVSLAFKIDYFSQSFSEHFMTRYPQLSDRGSKSFWFTVFTGVLTSGTHPSEEVNAAVAELQLKHKSTI